MKTNGQLTLDAIAEPDDHVDVRVYEPIKGMGLTLAIDVNGVTVIRLGRIKNEIELVRE